MSKSDPWSGLLEKRAFQWLYGLRGSLFLLTVLLPALFFGGTVRSSVFLIQALILLGAGLYIVQLIFFENDPVYLNRIKKPLIFFSLFVGYVAFQWIGRDLVFSKAFPGSIAVFKTRDYLIQLICYVLFFVTSLDLIASRKRVTTVTFLIGLQSVFLMALGYYQQSSHPEKLFKLYGVFDLSQYGTYFSSFTNPNHYGGYLMLATLLFLAWIAYYLASVDFFRLDGDFSRALFFGLLSLLASFSILRAEARTALWVQIGSILIFSVMSVYANVKKSVNWTLVLASIAALLGSTFFLVFKKFDFSQLTPTVLWKDFGERTAIYADALKIVKDFPVFGTGLGTAMYAITPYQVTAVEQYSWVHLYSHHLELMTNTGLVGYLLFMAPLAWLVLTSFRACLKHPSRWRRVYGIGSLTAIAAVVSFSVIDDYLITPALAILFLVFLMILTLAGNNKALFLDERADAPSVPVSPQRIAPEASRLRVGGLMLIAIAFIFFTAWKDFKAIDIISGDHAGIRQLKKAVFLRPDDPKIWIKLGDYYFDKAVTLKGQEHIKTAKEAVAAYDKAVSLTPTYGYYWMLAGRARVLARDRIRGLRHIARGAELMPYNRDYALYLIVNALTIARATPWPEESAQMKELAYVWVKKTFRLKRPLSETDHEYIRTAGDVCYGVIPEDIQSELLGFIKKAWKEERPSAVVNVKKSFA